MCFRTEATPVYECNQMVLGTGSERFQVQNCKRPGLPCCLWTSNQVNITEYTLGFRNWMEGLGLATVASTGSSGALVFAVHRLLKDWLTYEILGFPDSSFSACSSRFSSFTFPLTSALSFFRSTSISLAVTVTSCCVNVTAA